MGDQMGDNDDFDILSDKVIKRLERIYLIMAALGTILIILGMLS